MELLNVIRRDADSISGPVLREAIEILLKLIAPISPHIAEELWKETGGEGSIIEQKWPGWDDEIAKEEEIELVVQVNGKVRAKLKIPAGLDDDSIKKKIFAETKVKEYLKDKPLKKVIVVKGRLVNIYAAYLPTT